MYNKGIYIIYMHIYINNYRLRPPLRQARGRSEASAGARLLGDRRQDPAALPPTCSPSRSHRPRCDDLACQPVHSAGVCTRECPAAISNYRQDPVVPLTPLRGRCLRRPARCCGHHRPPGLLRCRQDPVVRSGASDPPDGKTRAVPPPTCSRLNALEGSQLLSGRDRPASALHARESDWRGPRLIMASEPAPEPLPGAQDTQELTATEPLCSLLRISSLSTAAPLHPTSSLASHQLLHPVLFNIDYIYRIGHRQPPLDFSFDKGAQLRGSQFATSRPCQQLSLASPASSRARLRGSIGIAIRYGAWPGENRGVAPARGWRQQPKRAWLAVNAPAKLTLAISSNRESRYPSLAPAVWTEQVPIHPEGTDSHTPKTHILLCS